MKRSTDPLETPATPPEIKHRLVVPIQTRGNLGKSTEAIARCEWMTARGVQWKGYDLDISNRTLSTAFSERVSFVRLGAEPEGSVIRILRCVTHAEVTVIDPSAHMDQVILKAFRMIQFVSMAAKAQARTTVMIYPIDEVSDMDDIASTVETLGNAVDWIIVRNPTRIPTTKFFDQSPLERLLQECGAATLNIPSLLTDTRNYLRTEEVRRGRSFSPAQALQDTSLHLDFGHLLILEDWLTDFYHRFDEVSSHLLPTAAATRIPSRPPVAATQAPSKRGRSMNLESEDE